MSTPNVITLCSKKFYRVIIRKMEYHCSHVSFCIFTSLSPRPVCLSCAFHPGKPACPHYGIQKVIKDEATGAAEC